MEGLLAYTQGGCKIPADMADRCIVAGMLILISTHHDLSRFFGRTPTDPAFDPPPTHRAWGTVVGMRNTLIQHAQTALGRYAFVTEVTEMPRNTAAPASDANDPQVDGIWRQWRREIEDNFGRAEKREEHDDHRLDRKEDNRVYSK